jgi:hypothetical protein
VVPGSSGAFGAERYERSDFQAKVCDLFQQLRTPSWLVVDAGQEADTVFAQLIAAAKEVGCLSVCDSSHRSRSWRDRRWRALRTRRLATCGKRVQVTDRMGNRGGDTSRVQRITESPAGGA